MKCTILLRTIVINEEVILKLIKTMLPSFTTRCDPDISGAFVAAESVPIARSRDRLFNLTLQYPVYCSTEYILSLVGNRTRGDSTRAHWQFKGP